MSGIDEDWPVGEEEAGNAHDLLPPFVLAKLPPLYSQDGKGMSAIAWVKWFSPVGAATWFISEYDPGERIAFGWCDLGMGFPELGNVSVDELEAIALPLGLKIERDIWFTPRTLREAVEAHGR